MTVTVAPAAHPRRALASDLVALARSCSRAVRAARWREVDLDLQIALARRRHAAAADRSQRGRLRRRDGGGVAGGAAAGGCGRDGRRRARHLELGDVHEGLVERARGERPQAQQPPAAEVARRAAASRSRARRARRRRRRQRSNGWPGPRSRTAGTGERGAGSSPQPARGSIRTERRSTARPRSTTRSRGRRVGRAPHRARCRRSGPPRPQPLAVVVRAGERARATRRTSRGPVAPSGRRRRDSPRAHVHARRHGANPGRRK